MATIVKRIDPATLNLKEQVVAINRVTKVVKGGKNLSFSALVVIGDPQAKVVGYGVGKAKEVPSAIRKGIEAAKKNLRKVHVLETTIAHRVLGQYASSQVLLKPAAAGFSSTWLEAYWPSTRWAMVVSSTWTLRRFFLAASIPLRIALGTSLALPTP